MWRLIERGTQTAIPGACPSSWTLRTPREDFRARMVVSAFGLTKPFAQTRILCQVLSRKASTIDRYRWSSLCYWFYMLACFSKVFQHRRLNRWRTPLVDKDLTSLLQRALYISMIRDDFKISNSANASSPGRSYTVSLPSIARLKNGSCASQAVDIWFVCISDCRTVEIAPEFHFVTYKTYWSSGRLTMTQEQKYVAPQQSEKRFHRYG